MDWIGDPILTDRRHFGHQMVVVLGAYVFSFAKNSIIRSFQLYKSSSWTYMLMNVCVYFSANYFTRRKIFDESRANLQIRGVWCVWCFDRYLPKFLFERGNWTRATKYLWFSGVRISGAVRHLISTWTTLSRPPIACSPPLDHLYSRTKVKTNVKRNSGHILFFWFVVELVVHFCICVASFGFGPLALPNLRCIMHFLIQLAFCICWISFMISVNFCWSR